MAWGRYRRRYSYSRRKPAVVTKLEELSKGSFDEYNRQVFGEGSEYIASINGFKLILAYTPRSIQSYNWFRHSYGNALVNLLEEKISTKAQRYGHECLHNYEYPGLILLSEEHLNSDAKDKIVDQIVKYNKNFYSKNRKNLIEFAMRATGIDCLDQENGRSRAIEMIREFHRILSTDQFDVLINRVPEGLNDPDVSLILGKTKMYDYLEYSEKKVNSDEKTKIKLTKALAKTPSLIKKIPFDVKIEFDHLKFIAPAMRFKFMQFAFKQEVNFSRYGWQYGSALKYRISNAKRKNKVANLIMPEINTEQMKELLFSVCLKKNSEFATWINNYDYYLQCINSPIGIPRIRS